MVKFHLEDYNEYTNGITLVGYEGDDMSIELTINLDSVFQYSVLERPTATQRENIDSYITMRVKDIFGDKAEIESLTSAYVDEE